MVHTSIVRVRFPETDLMGWAHHSVFFIWFEIGRTELLRQADLTYRSFVENGLHFPVIEAYCHYFYAVGYDEEIRIETRIRELSRVHVVFRYDILKSDGLRSALGWTKHGVMREDKRKLVKMPEELFVKLRQCIEEDFEDDIT